MAVGLCANPLGELTALPRLDLGMEPGEKERDGRVGMRRRGREGTVLQTDRRPPLLSCVGLTFLNNKLYRTLCRFIAQCFCFCLLPCGRFYWQQHARFCSQVYRIALSTRSGIRCCHLACERESPQGSRHFLTTANNCILYGRREGHFRRRPRYNFYSFRVSWYNKPRIMLGALHLNEL